MSTEPFDIEKLKLDERSIEVRVKEQLRGIILDREIPQEYRSICALNSAILQVVDALQVFTAELAKTRLSFMKEETDGREV